MIANRALATLWPWKGVARDGPLTTVEFCGVRVPLGAVLCTMTNELRSNTYCGAVLTRNQARSSEKPKEFV
jgi:hypothetical protein